MLNISKVYKVSPQILHGSTAHWMIFEGAMMSYSYVCLCVQPRAHRQEATGSVYSLKKRMEKGCSSPAKEDSACALT